MQNKNLKKIESIIPIVSIIPADEKIIVLSYKDLLFCITYLKLNINSQYKILSCISGVDFISCKYRFGIIYDLLSLKFNSRIRLKVFINEITPVDTLINIYPNANWWEREIWDFFGLYFSKNADLRRILTDYGFEGHPMRKDFPLSGYIEVKYDVSTKSILLQSVELSQDFRSFLYSNT